MAYSVVFVGPIRGIKPTVVLEALLEADVDWSRSLVVLDGSALDTPLWRLVQSRGLRWHEAHDLSLASELDALGQPDFLVTCGWGHRVDIKAIRLARIAALNCHSAYLPDYKGANAYQHCWANCETHAGATIHHLTRRFDAGNIVAQQRFKLFLRDTPRTILWRASELTAGLLIQAMHQCANGDEGQPQSGGRYFFKISRSKLLAHRAWNLLSKAGVPRRLTPHKTIPNRPAR